jgi:Zn-dependent peptidase ImmA (M78 family)
VINGQDAEGTARTFTLFHEYAHLLIRQPGVSDQNRKNSTEQWCNEFAAYFLMPPERFKREAVAIDPGSHWSDTAIRKLADLFNVSMSAVTLHLEEVGLAKPGLYERKWEEWRKRKKGKPFAQMSYPERQVQRLGVRHVGVVLDAVDKGDINQLEAYELMDVDPRFYGDLKKEVEERQKTYGGVR